MITKLNSPRIKPLYVISKVEWYIFIHIYICCEVISWSKFGLFNGHELVQVRVINWSKVIFDLYFLWVQAIFLLSYHIVFFFGAQLSGNFLK